MPDVRSPPGQPLRSRSSPLALLPMRCWRTTSDALPSGARARLEKDFSSFPGDWKRSSAAAASRASPSRGQQDGPHEIITLLSRSVLGARGRATRGNRPGFVAGLSDASRRWTSCRLPDGLNSALSRRPRGRIDPSQCVSDCLPVLSPNGARRSRQDRGLVYRTRRREVGRADLRGHRLSRRLPGAFLELRRLTEASGWRPVRLELGAV